MRQPGLCRVTRRERFPAAGTRADMSERCHPPSPADDERFKTAIRNAPLGIVVAHVDQDLRYTWIYNPHPDFDPEKVIGKRDDEIALNEGTIRLRDLKRRVIESGTGAQDIIVFPVSDGPLIYKIAVEPVVNEAGRVIGATSVSVDITGLIRAGEAQTRLIHDLQKALAEVRTLQGMLPLCTYCKKIRNDKGYWEQVDEYIANHSAAEISHSICPDCGRRYFPEVYGSQPPTGDAE